MGFPPALALFLQLATAVNAGVAALAIYLALRRRRARLAMGLFAAALIWTGGYAVLLLNVSRASREQVLEWGEAKAFCGAYLDCHIHVTVEGVESVAELGSAERPLRARGRFLAVTLKVFSDAVRASLAAGPLEARVVDAAGRTYGRALEAERALEAARGSLGPLDRAIGPGESYARVIVFDLPADAREPRLDVRQGGWMTRLSEALLIGDEDSLLHRRVLFRLERPQA